MSSKQYLFIQGSKVTSCAQTYDSSCMDFSAVASTNYAVGDDPSRKVRVNLPALHNKSLNRDQLYVPVESIPEKLLKAIESGEEIRVFLRNRKEILSSFSLMMEHDPNCLTLVNSR